MKPISAKEIPGKYFTVENEAVRLNLPIFNAVTNKGYVTIGTMVSQESDGKTFKFTAEGWKEIPGPQVIDELRAVVSVSDNLESFVDIMFDLQRRVIGLEQAASDAVNRQYTGLVFAEGSLKQDFLPIHETSHFCRDFEFIYTGDFSGASTSEVIKINNKALNITAVSVKDTVRVYTTYNAMNDTITVNVQGYDAATPETVVDYGSADLEDSFILTLEVVSQGISPTMVNCNITLSRLAYSDVDLKYDYPVFELRDGTIVYRNAAPTTFMGRTYDILACYQLGELTTSVNAPLCCDNGAGVYVNTPCEYVYMANWFWIKNCTLFQSPFDVFGNGTNLNNRKETVKHLDISKLTLPAIKGLTKWLYGYAGEFLTNDLAANIPDDLPSNTDFCVYGTWIKTLGSHLGEIDASKFKSFIFRKCYSIQTLGDLSGWDTSNITSVSTMFSQMYLLESIGDIGSWDLSSCTDFANFFKQCFNLRSLTDKIGDWNTSKVTRCPAVFQSCNYIGDETLHTLYKWDTHLFDDVRCAFAYEWETAAVVQAHDFYASLRKPYPTIVNKRTDLSFLDKWDMTACTKFAGMMANNPYLTNVGDLRKWTLTALAANPSGTNYGFQDFLLNCSGLENLKMPTIPRGTVVTDFVKGCTSLANVELDELNVEAISFADCPLTKQSVLNLINAATDNVEITLKDTVYTAVHDDADILAAIAAKTISSITVQLVSA